MNSIDHIDADDAYADRASLDRECCHATASFAWEETLPGYSHDSGSTGTIEVSLSGRVIDGECEDVEAYDFDRACEVEIPSREYERACKALIEAAASMGG